MGSPGVQSTCDLSADGMDVREVHLRAEETPGTLELRVAQLVESHLELLKARPAEFSPLVNADVVVVGDKVAEAIEKLGSIEKRVAQLEADALPQTEKPLSLYAFCVEELSATHIELDDTWSTLVSTLRMIALLVLLMSMQYMLLFAYLDSSWFEADIGLYPAFKDAIGADNFYGATLQLHPDDEHTPMIDVLASFSAMLLLAVVSFREDAIQTTLVAQPIDRLLFERNAHGVVDFLISLLLFVAWLMRAMLFPTMAAVGSANAFGAAGSSVDVVLDAVAIGFIFEADDLLYRMLLYRGERRSYERGRPKPASATVDEGHTERSFSFRAQIVHLDENELIGKWGHAVALCNFGTMTMAYLSVKFPRYFEAGNGVYDNKYWQIAANMWILGGIHGGLSVCLVVRHYWLQRAKMSASSLLWVLAKLVFSTGMSLSAAIFAYKVLYQGASQLLGYSDMCMDQGSQIYECLHSFTRTAECANDVLNWTAYTPDLPTPSLQSTYSYQDEHWSMRSWGPVTPGCLPPRRWVA